MAQVLLSMVEAHIAFCDEHYFQIEVMRASVEALAAKMLECLADHIISPSPILPMEVEEEAILVHHTGAPWAMVLSRQHRQRLRHDSGGSRLNDSLISIHVKMPPGVWGLVESDGYCGYAVILRLLDPSSSRFVHTNAEHRATLQQSLIRLLSQLPEDFPEKAVARARLAIRHLDSADRLPRNAWCHMDLVMHVTTTSKLPF